MVTLQDPAFVPLTAVPDTLQFLLDAGAIFIANFAPAGIFTLANASNVVFDAVFPIPTVEDAVATVVEPPLAAGTVVIEEPLLLVGVVVAGATVAGTVTTGSAAGTTGTRAEVNEPSGCVPVITATVNQYVCPGVSDVNSHERGSPA